MQWATLPNVLLWAFICVIVAVRLILLNTTRADLCLNAALFWITLSCLLRSPALGSSTAHLTSNAVSAAAVAQVGEAMVLPAAGAMFMMAYTWVRQNEPAYFAPTVYVASTLSAIVVCVLCMHARTSNPAMHDAPGWAALAHSVSPATTVIALLAHDILIYWFAITIMYVIVQELRHRPPVRAVIICMVLLILSAGSLAQTVGIEIATVSILQGTPQTSVETLTRIGKFSTQVYAFLLTSIAAVPVATIALERARLDRFSLLRRRLMPLWSDLTAACPEVKQLLQPHGIALSPRYVLHRTVVEIRDSILILSRYATRTDEQAVRGQSTEPAKQTALQLAMAWQAKTQGKAPTGGLIVQRSAATDLHEETQELLQLASHWKNAKRAAATRAHVPTSSIDTLRKLGA